MYQSGLPESAAAAQRGSFRPDRLRYRSPGAEKETIEVRSIDNVAVLKQQTERLQVRVRSVPLRLREDCMERQQGCLGAAAQPCAH